jgi:hypothetical protein
MEARALLQTFFSLKCTLFAYFLHVFFDVPHTSYQACALQTFCRALAYMEQSEYVSFHCSSATGGGPSALSWRVKELRRRCYGHIFAAGGRPRLRGRSAVVSRPFNSIGYRRRRRLLPVGLQDEGGRHARAGRSGHEGGALEARNWAGGGTGRV